MSQAHPTITQRSRGIPDAVIASVKTNTSFLSLLKSYGIDYRKAGSGYKAICPFHNVDGHSEKDPSFSISPTTNLGHCFGCGTSVNVIQFVQQMEKISFPEAVKKLLAIKGAKIEPAVKEEKPPTTPELPEEERQAILVEVLRLCTQALSADPAARHYLETRGLDTLRLSESFELGYWPHGLYGDLHSSERKKLSSVGLATNGSDIFDQCVIVPFRKDGRITTIYGRKTATPSSADVGRHYLLPHKREGLFLPTAGLDPRAPVIITESVIDGFSLFTAGITNVLPLLGVNGFLADHLEYLKAQRFPMIYIALNGDDAGNRAAAALKQKLEAEKLPAEIVELPAGKDLNDMLREMGPGKLKEWFAERTGETTSGDKPTLWEDDAGDTFVTIEDREYRVRGLSTVGMDRLKVNLKVRRISDRDTFHVDTLDLYLAKSREVFVNHASRVLECEPARIARDVNALITLLEELRLRKKDGEENGRKRYEMSEQEKQEALDYLRSPDLLDRVSADFEACGMVGNRNQNLLAYLGGLSRLTDQPFGTLIVSRSGAGKSFLQDMTANMVPEESLLRMTRLTGQSLFYQGKDGLKHKLLTIEEDEGMQDAMYSIRTLLSSQRLTLHGLRTDPKTGEFRAFENTVGGPTSVMISTTNLSAFTFENVNRFFVIFLDESRDQTRAILEHQRRVSGLAKIDLRINRRRIEKLHRNIQRLLKPVMVINRIGTGIEYPEEILNTRREQTKTETLIETVALLHQYQRTIQTATLGDVEMQYIEVTKEDLAAVHRIAGDILQQSLDEMPKLCRDLLVIIHEIVGEKYKAAAKEARLECADRESPPERWQISFTRKELQERSRWSRWHLEEHLKELEEAGYIVQRIGKKGQRYAYSLVEDAMPAMPSVKRSV
jgi:DNA primase catalytic core